MRSIRVRDLSDLSAAAEKIVNWIDDRNPIVAFYGPMGAGKTTLIREICQHMGVTDTVNSPTFAIVNEYRTEEGNRICHFDFYRIEKTEEVFDFGYEEYFYSGDLCLIEWPERIEEILPLDISKVLIAVDEDGSRHISIL